MTALLKSLLGASALTMLSLSAYAETTLTIGTVNNGNMIDMQKLTDDFTKKNPDIKLNWVTLEENVLRQKVTTDIATKGGQFDIMTIGTYEVPIWGKRGWLVPLDKLGADYDENDLLPAIRSGLTVNGKLEAAPFYGESSFVMYRKDLMDKAGLKMPEAPDWKFIREAADKMTDKAAGIYGICLRGKAGWGENMAFLTATSNSFGARWFDMKWQPQFNSPEWKATLDYYLAIMKADGPPGASSNGFNENLALFNSGKCGMWIDATVAAVLCHRQGFHRRRQGRLRARARRRQGQARQLALGLVAGDSLGLGQGRCGGEVHLVGDRQSLSRISSPRSWAGRSVPPGTRTSLYKNPDYLKAAPFAELTLKSIDSADPTHPTVEPVPYVGVQFVAIPEFAGIATDVGQDFSAALAGNMTEDAALAKAQASTEAAMKKAGYYK